MKNYRGRGDNGTAGLFSGERVAKSHERIDALGALDELNAALGVLRASLSKENGELGKEIRHIQSHVLQAGAWIATWRGSPTLKQLKEIGEDHIRFLEAAVNRIDEKLPEIEGFIIPGAHPIAALAHAARAVCRRTERHAVRLSVEVTVGKSPKQLREVIIYLNRLSDYLFVLGRYCNYLSNVPDEIWKM